MERPIITLTTDFGLADHYVGTMKGVILSRSPQAQLVDISHEIPAFSIYAGAYAIDQAAPYFPPGTVHVVVVDPGVGTERKPLYVEVNGQHFIAPDNGVLSWILARDSTALAREIANRGQWLATVSATFHGRDVFAPVAAAVATGRIRADEIGPLLKNPALLKGLEPRQIDQNFWEGTVLSIDRFGNVITNFKSADFSRALAGEFVLSASAGDVTLFHLTFGGAPRDVCFSYPGSSGYIEIGINQGNAAGQLSARAGSPVCLKVSN